MGDSFTIQISTTLVRQLADGTEKLKKKTHKPKKKAPWERHQPQTKVHQKHDDSEILKGPTRWPTAPEIPYLPVPPPQFANAELDAIRSVLQESEKVVERLQKQELDMLQGVTQRAKDLHDKEFKLPNQIPMSCLADKDACFNCYRENAKDPLKCAALVESYANCTRRVRQQVSSAEN